MILAAIIFLGLIFCGIKIGWHLHAVIARDRRQARMTEDFDQRDINRPVRPAFLR